MITNKNVHCAQVFVIITKRKQKVCLLIQFRINKWNIKRVDQISAAGMVILP